jgi:hypothetical protein
MINDGRIERSLSLLAKPGAYDVLHAMHSRDGTATYAQITAAVRNAVGLLRALAAEGFVFSYRGGSLDIEPPATTSFCLTAKGEAIAAHLARLSEWAVARSHRRRNARTGW